MSVAIVVKVSEGLVLAADSAVTVHGHVEGPNETSEGIVKTYFNAKKLLQIGDFPIGVVTWGTGYLGPRSVESHIREWEYRNNWTSITDYRVNVGDKSFAVRRCAEGLHKHLTEVHTGEYNTESHDGFPFLGVIVAGYSEGAFFPEIWRFVIPHDGEILELRPDIDGKPDFGANWFGLTEAIIRFHWGRDDKALTIISEKYSIPEKEIREALGELQYSIPFPVMPLQDAVEYAHFMLSIAIGRYKFVAGPELCGGEIDIAAITHNKFHWIAPTEMKL